MAPLVWLSRDLIDMTLEKILAKHIERYTHVFCENVEAFVSQGIGMEHFFSKRVPMLQKLFIKSLMKDLSKNDL